MYRNGRSISHGGEAAESTTSARSPIASSTKPGNECWPRNRSSKQKIYKRQSIDSFEAAWRPGGGPRPSGGQVDGRSSSQAARRRIAVAFGWRGSIQARLVAVGSRRPCTRTRRKDTKSPPTSTIDGVSPKAMLKPRRAPAPIGQCADRSVSRSARRLKGRGAGRGLRRVHRRRSRRGFGTIPIVAWSPAEPGRLANGRWIGSVRSINRSGVEQVWGWHRNRRLIWW
jgi:hypothetical protein